MAASRLSFWFNELVVVRVVVGVVVGLDDRGISFEFVGPAVAGSVVDRRISSPEHGADRTSSAGTTF